jgi:predicted nucleic acid-binding protein
MAKVVIDASLAAAWCFPDEYTDYTNEVLRIVGTTVDPIAPTLWGYEINNTILMSFKRGRITKNDAERLLVFLGELDVQLVAPPSYGAVFHLAEAHGLTVYDAAYLDLALREGTAIATLDKALRSAARKAGVPIFDVKQSTDN